jgi:hypothetical protein
MSEVIVTTADARALISLVNYIEDRFPAGPEYDPSRWNWTVQSGATAATGEPFVDLTTREWQPSRDALIEAAKKAFDAYAEGKTGTLYWRVRPEIAEDSSKGWRFYMRLLISDKEAK